MPGRAEVPPLRLGTAYFGTALTFLVCGAAGLVVVAPRLAAGAYPLRSAIAITHLFTLGWITLSMMGALHHFMPVSLQVQLMPIRCAWFQLTLFSAGLIAFVGGELLSLRPLAFTGAALLGVALLAFALRLVLAAFTARRSGRTARALLAGGIFLVSAAVLGVLLAGDVAFGWLHGQRLPVLALHVHVALAGWVLLVVTAVGQRLLPMFLLTAAPPRRVGATSLALIAAGAAALLVFAGAPALLRVWLPFTLIAAGAALFLGQSAILFSRPGVPELDPGLRFTGVALVFQAIAIVLTPFALRHGFADPQRLVLYTAAAVLAGLALMVCGHYYRIVPFLVWSQRFSTHPHPGQRGPQSLYRHDVAIMALVAFVTGVTTVLVGFAHGTGGGARAGAILLLLGVLLLAGQLASVLRSRPVA